MDLIQPILTKNSEVKNTVIEEEKFFTKEQVKKALIETVSNDKFVDHFYSLLVRKYGAPKN